MSPPEFGQAAPAPRTVWCQSPPYPVTVDLQTESAPSFDKVCARPENELSSRGSPPVKNLRDHEKEQTNAGYQGQPWEGDRENILHLQRRAATSVAPTDSEPTHNSFNERVWNGVH